MARPRERGRIGGVGGPDPYDRAQRRTERPGHARPRQAAPGLASTKQGWHERALLGAPTR